MSAAAASLENDKVESQAAGEAAKAAANEKSTTSENSGSAAAGKQSQESEVVNAGSSTTAVTMQGEEASQEVISLIVEAPNGKQVRVQTTASDVVVDIREFLLDCPETCFLTSYSLSHEDVKLNDYMELKEYPQLKAGQSHTLKVVPELYDERTARMHVRRLRELLVKPPVQVHHQFYSLVTASDKEKEVQKDNKGSAKTDKEADAQAKGKKGKGKDNGPATKGKEKEPEGEESSVEYQKSLIEDDELFTLLNLAPDPLEQSEARANASLKNLECLRNIGFSAWNPPPGNRALRGDLLYLEITTVEGHTLHITSSVEGFFLNKSTSSQFDPDPADASYRSHTLVELLKKASNAFKTWFQHLLLRKIQTHPFQSVQPPRKVERWIDVAAQAVPHSYDWNRAEDALLSTYGMDLRGVLRDWNEEYQGCHELPAAHLQERILRDRTVYRVYNDFLDAATKGASAIVENNITPINPMDPPRAWVFVYNNIFFSFAIDGRDQYLELGGDKVAHVLARHDLHAVALIAENHKQGGLCTLATVLVDYRGHRVVAQSIVPGIFHGDRASTPVYGSMDHGKTIASDPEFHKMFLEATSSLGIAEHKVLDGEGNEHTLAACVDTKGIVGSDNRSYVLDLTRVTPRDANYPEWAEHPTCVLRHELLKRYLYQQYNKVMTARRTKFMEAHKAKVAELEEEKKKKEEEGKAGEEGAADKTKTKEIPASLATNSDELKSKPDADASKEAQDKDKEEDKSEEDKEAEGKAEILAEMQEAGAERLSINLDCFTDAKLGDPAEKVEEDKAQITRVSEFLLVHTLPDLVKEFNALTTVPADGFHLCDIMHERGVNLRYLGKLAQLCAEAPTVETAPLAEEADQKDSSAAAEQGKEKKEKEQPKKEGDAEEQPKEGEEKEKAKPRPDSYGGAKHIVALCEKEMLARAAKTRLRAALRAVGPDKAKAKQHWFLSPCIARFLNSFLGKHCGGQDLTEEQLITARVMAEMEKKHAKAKQEAAIVAQAAALAAQNGEAVAARSAQGTAVAAEATAAAEAAAQANAIASGGGKKKKKGKKGNRKAGGDDGEVEGPVLRLADGSRAPDDPLSPANQWHALRALVQEKYKYRLPQRCKFSARDRLCLLRALCLRVGVRVRAKKYDWNSEKPFSDDDVLALFPVTKQHMPANKEAAQLLVKGRLFLTAGRAAPAYATLQDAIQLHIQVFGPMHRGTAEAYVAMASVLHAVQDYSQAVEHQHRATIILQRVVGPDHYLTAEAHAMLAVYLQSLDRPDLALRHLGRAASVFELISGPNSPKSAVSLLNLGTLYMNLEDTHTALQLLLKSRSRMITCLGPNHMQIGIINHTIAVAHALVGSFRTALEHETQAKQIFKAALGEDNPMVQQCNLFINQFGSNAVKAAKQAQKFALTSAGGAGLPIMPAIANGTHAGGEAAAAATAPATSATANTATAPGIPKKGGKKKNKKKSKK